MADKGHWKALLYTQFVLLFLFGDFVVDTTAGLHKNGLSEEGSNVCKRSKVVTYETVIYTVQYYTEGYKIKCALFGWKRCQRYRTKSRSVERVITRQRTDYYLHCCDGWRRSGSSCQIAICRQGCNNGGTCVRPNGCVCSYGWTGSTCSKVVTTSRLHKNGLSEEGSNVCKRSEVVTYETVIYIVQYYQEGYKIKCGPFGWKRCQRHRQKTRAHPKKISRTRIDSYLQCCDGWRRRGSSCPIAICSQGCNNGGTCVRPNECDCSWGWTGSTCSEPICRQRCDNGGTCVRPNGCVCSSGWTGSRCKRPPN